MTEDEVRELLNKYIRQLLIRGDRIVADAIQEQKEAEYYD